jgi:hypothetical protein
MSPLEAAWRSLTEPLAGLWRSLEGGIGAFVGLEGVDPFAGETWRSVARLGRPVEPFDRPDFLAPLIGIAGLLVGVLLCGVALASLGSLLVSLIALGLLLTRVFGISVEVGAPAA